MAGTRLNKNQLHTLGIDNVTTDEELKEEFTNHNNQSNPHPQYSLLTQINKNIVGLGKVDNTSDLEKPISVIQAVALNQKINISQVNTVNGVCGLDGNGLVGISFLPDLPYYNSSSGIPWSNITGVPAILPNLTSTIQVVPASGTTLIPYDNTTPLVTEGTQIANASYSASSVNSKLSIDGCLVIDCSSANRTFIITLFRDSICIGAAALNFISVGKPQILPISFSDLNLGSTFDSVVTYSLRIGLATSGTWYVNRMANAVLNGKMSANSIIFSEYL